MEVNAQSEQEQFKSGEALPPATRLIELLNDLSIAYEKGNKGDVQRLETEICTMVASGVYEGYLKDDSDDCQTFFVRFVSIQRRDPKGTSANIHSFTLTMEVLDVIEVAETKTIDLVDFLRDVNREGVCGRQHKGPRFWPL